MPREPTMTHSEADEMTPFPDKLRAFIEAGPWTFAKTYAKTWPHEYLVRDQVGSGELFVQLVEHIRAQGYEANFYSRKLTYFDEDGFTYWTMGAPVAQTTIINRCRKENTFEERQKAGTLPD